MAARDVYSVSRLNREAKQLIETTLPALWIEGEVSNLSRPTSGHLYFCLKDAAAQVRCALFRGQARQVVSLPENGQMVLVRAQVTLYEGRGDFQLIVDQVEEAGEGALRRAFEALKRRLAAEGLFSEERKRPLPRLPRQIGIVTSASGAALHDILTTLRRRFPSIPVLIHPVPVQGVGAAERIARALEYLSSRPEPCDVLILARGGGSLEDLWPFNEERLARAIAACPIPVVTGVGHETDVTIADWVADVRGATPTAAAELVTPDGPAWLARTQELARRLDRGRRHFFAERALRLDYLVSRLPRPDQRLHRLRDRIRDQERRLHHSQQRYLRDRVHALEQRVGRLAHASPVQRLARMALRLAPVPGRLTVALRGQIKAHRQRVTHTASRLQPPEQRLRVHAGKVAEYLARLQRGMRSQLVQRHQKHLHTQARLYRAAPVRRVPELHAEVVTQSRRLRSAMSRTLARRGVALGQTRVRLHTLDPWSTVTKRGYSILTLPDKTVVRSRGQVVAGDYVSVLVGDGRVECVVAGTRPHEGTNGPDRRD